MRKLALMTCAAGALFAGGQAAAQEVFLGEVRTFSYNFCPRGWAETKGQLFQISQESALFALIGTQFGGDGRTTFAVPDLQGRVVVGPGQGAGLSNYSVGERGGAESTTLSQSQMPAHDHIVPTSGVGGTLPVREAKNGVAVVSSTNSGSTVSSQTGGGMPHDNRPPYLAMTTCIAMQGVFPTRN